jgi:translation initiation factor 3 subunit B
MAAEPVDPLDVARQLFKDQPVGFPYEGFLVEELILPDGDDMGVPSEDEDVMEEETDFETGFGSVIGAGSVNGLSLGKGLSFAT